MECPSMGTVQVGRRNSTAKQFCGLENVPSYRGDPFHPRRSETGLGLGVEAGLLGAALGWVRGVFKLRPVWC